MIEELQSGSANHRIDYPGTPTEFELHAKLYCGLRARGIDARGEVMEIVRGSRRPLGFKCRFDIVIFEEKRAVLVIEVKKNATGRLKYPLRRQASRYTAFGCPVWFVRGLEGVDHALARLIAEHELKRRKAKTLDGVTA